MGIAQLLLIGDSISIHYNPFLKQALLGKMDVFHKGDLPGEESLDPNGRDSNEVLAYLYHLCDRRFTTNLLLINSGLHDIKRQQADGPHQVEPDTYRRNLETMVSLVSNLAEQMLWISTTPVDDAIHNSREQGFLRFNADVLHYNQIAQTVMQAAGIPIIDLYRFTQQIGAPESLYQDHVHFQEDISRLQGEYIAGYLQLTASAG